MTVVFGHVAGVPVEETIGALGPAVFAALSLATFNMRSRWQRRKVRGRG